MNHQPTPGGGAPAHTERAAGSVLSPAPLSSVAAPTPTRGLELTELKGLELDGMHVDGVAIELDLASAVLEPRAVPDRRLTSLAADPTFWVAVNAGYFERDGSPSGLLASSARRYGLLDRRGGSGIVIVSAERAQLVPFEGFPSNSFRGELAVQSGPRLIEPNGSLGMRSDDGQRAPRTVLCVMHQGRSLALVLLWSREEPARGPGLMTVARLLTGPSPRGSERWCEQALNLDGGPSTGIVYSRAFTRRVTPEHLPLGPVPWALVARPRVGTANPSSAPPQP
ncbi:MAG TPA: phosphodiester glycosidase family protein [Polyangiaceae bacterium]|nr:phosphodiester glycosidase family protein [Polyangiaceae bacterium]